MGFLEKFRGLKRQKKHWYHINDCLPPTDEEVIVINKIGRISWGHIVDKTIAKNYNGWNIPDIVCWRKGYSKELEALCLQHKEITDISLATK